MNFTISQQNDDGGFRIGNDLNSIASMFTGSSEIIDFFKGIINENLSSVETSFWALNTLRDIRKLNWNVIMQSTRDLINRRWSGGSKPSRIRTAL